MNELQVILLSTILPILISGAVTIFGIFLQVYLTRKFNNKDIKFDLLSKINDQLLDNYDFLFKTCNVIPEIDLTKNGVADLFTDNLIAVYNNKKVEFEKLNNIFNRAKIILCEKETHSLKKEFERLNKLECNLFASAFSKKLGGVDSIIENGIEINGEIDFISPDKYEASIREYIDSVSALKAQLATIVEDYMKKLLN